MASIWKCFAKQREGVACIWNTAASYSIFIYKPWLVNEGGLNMSVAYPVNFFQTNMSLAQT